MSELKGRPNELIAKFALWFGRKELSEIINIEKFDYEVIDNMVYIYKLVEHKPQPRINNTIYNGELVTCLKCNKPLEWDGFTYNHKVE